MERPIGSLEPGKRADLIVVVDVGGAADADVRSAVAPGLRHARRRCADDDRGRTRADARPQGADAATPTQVLADARALADRARVRQRGPAAGGRGHDHHDDVLHLSEAQIHARIVELAARDRADYPGRGRDSPGRRAQGRLHVHGGSGARDERARHAGFHRGVELRQGHASRPARCGCSRTSTAASRAGTSSSSRTSSTPGLTLSVPAGHPARARTEDRCGPRAC